MKPASWRLLRILARALKPSERAVVLGDLAESGTTFGTGLLDLLGLIIRRQAGLWMMWRPWVALFGISGVAGLQLSVLAFRLNLDIGRQWMAYSKYGTHYDTGLTPQQDTAFLLCMAIALISWSWTSGFVLGSLSGRAAWLTWAVFYLVIVNAPWAGLLFRDLILRHPLPSGFWLGVALPLRATTGLVLVPALYGTFLGARRRGLRATYSYLVTAVTIVFTILAVWTGSWYEHAHEIWSGGVWRGSSHSVQLLPWVLLSWPGAWLLATRCRRRPSRTVADQ